MQWWQGPTNTGTQPLLSIFSHVSQCLSCTHFYTGQSLQHTHTISSSVTGKENGSWTSTMQFVQASVTTCLEPNFFSTTWLNIVFPLISDLLQFFFFFFFSHMDFLPDCFPESLTTGVFRSCSFCKVKMGWPVADDRFYLTFAGTCCLHTLLFSNSWGTIFLQNDTVSSQMMIVLIHHYENLKSSKFNLCTTTHLVPRTLFISCVHMQLYSYKVVEGENVLFKYA